MTAKEKNQTNVEITMDFAAYTITVTTHEPVKCTNQGLYGMNVSLSLEDVLTKLISEIKENPKIAEVFNRISKDQHSDGDKEYSILEKEYLEWYAEMYQHRSGL